MNITVEYSKRQYGLGEAVRQYQVTIREVDGLYIEKPENPAENYYQCREVEITFRASKATLGRGWDHWADPNNAEALGGRLELSHDAARQFAQAILQFLDAPKSPQTNVQCFSVTEKPERRGQDP